LIGDLIQRGEAAMAELNSLDSRYGAANYKPLPVTLVRGKGVKATQSRDENRYFQRK
jgi:hypothetical protein